MESKNNHYEETIESLEIKVVCLNTDAKYTAEDMAMLQALYSRDPASVYKHLDKLASSGVGSGKFMEQYYVGYGHESIGDCADLTFYIEKCSMLAAKAIQDSRLYNGQEVSTRYVDFSTIDVVPVYSSVEITKGPKETLKEFERSETTRRDKESTDVHDRDNLFYINQLLKSFYVKNTPVVEAFLTQKYPPKTGEKQGVYTKAIKAATFDIMRAFLPAGTRTSLSLHITLRHLANRLRYLKAHPLEEVRLIGDAIEKVARRACPHSFNHKQDALSTQFIDRFMRENYYNTDSYLRTNGMAVLKSNINYAETNLYKDLLSSRPKKSEIPHIIDTVATFTFDTLLDYGSYRDLQRHRSVSIKMPLLTTKFGFEKWYLDSLPVGVANEAKEMLLQIETVTTPLSGADLQYFLPMGYRVPVRIDGGLASLVYIAELRSGNTVHPTLRTLAIQIGTHIQRELPWLKMYMDTEASRFDIRRGTQDIVKIE